MATTTNQFSDPAELCAQIMVMAIEITRGGRYHVFAEYLGHVNCTDVRVLPGSPGVHRRRAARCRAQGHDLPEQRIRTRASG